MSRDGTIISSTSSASFTSIPNISHQLSLKLSASNYLLWKAQILPLLRGLNVAHHIDGTKPPPLPIQSDGITPNPDYASWYCYDQLVLSWITSSVSESVLTHIVGARTAFEAWRKIETTYASGSKITIRQLKSQLFRLKRENDSISTYMGKAKELSDKLASLGQPISDDDLVQAIIDGLGSAYRPFVRSLESRHTDVSFDELFGLLLSEERQLKIESDVEPFAPTAHYSARQNSGNYGRGRGRGGRGNRGRNQPNYSGNSHGTFSYNNVNNSAYNGQHSSGSNNQSQGSGDNNGNSLPTCHNCKGLGHISPVCPSPKLRKGNRPQSHFASPTTNPNQPWIVDSGASHHVTSELENLALHSEYQGTDELTLGSLNEAGEIQRPE